MPRTAIRALLVALLIVSMGPLATAQDQPGLVGVQISPTRVEQDLDGRGFVFQVSIKNNESTPREIRLRITGLGHDLDGRPTFPEPSAAAEAVAIEGEDRFVLQPGATGTTTLRGRIPSGQPALYGALVARYSVPGEDDGQVAIRSQVASYFLLRGPKPWRQTLRAVDVGVLPPTDEQAEAGGPYTVFGAAKNTGNAHLYARGTMRIFKNGELLDVVKLPENAIVPGYARRIGGTWEPEEVPDGTYHLEAVLRDPEVTMEGDVEFFDGYLEATAAEIAEMRGVEEQVSLAVVNTGTIAFAPSVTLVATRGGEEVSTETFALEELEPDGVDELVWEPELGPGLYDVTAQVADPEGDLLDQDVTGLKVPGPPWLWIAIGVAVALLLMLLFLWRRRRAEESPREVATRPQQPRSGTGRPAARPAPQPVGSSRPPGAPPPPPPPPPGR